MEWARLSWRGDCCRDDRFRDVLYFQLWRCWNPVSCRQARLIMATYMKSLKISNSEIYIWSFLRQCRCWCACRLYGEFKIIKPVAHWFHNIFKQSCPCFEISKRTLDEYLLPMTNLWGFVLNWFVKVSLTQDSETFAELRHVRPANWCLRVFMIFLCSRCTDLKLFWVHHVVDNNGNTK